MKKSTERTIQQNRRLLFIVSELKKRDRKKLDLLETINAIDLSRKDYIRAISSKTLQRDIAQLKEMGASIEQEGGVYTLMNRDWIFPALSLDKDELFASYFSYKLTNRLLPPQLQRHQQSTHELEVAVGESCDEAEHTVRSLIHATGKLLVDIDSACIDTIIDAWKHCQRVDLIYQRSLKPECDQRKLDIHALFLSNGIWYARGFCHLRQKDQAFALHRISAVTLCDEYYERDLIIVEDVNRGNLFPFDKIQNIKLQCSSKIASYIFERQWFPEQSFSNKPDDSLILSAPEAQEEMLLWWISSFKGEMTVLEPLSLRKKMAEIGHSILKNHS